MAKYVFTELYAWLTEEYRKSKKASEFGVPVRTVWGWYRKGHGLQCGQKLDRSETGHGLMMLVSTAACVRRDVPKRERLVVMPAEEVDATFRAQAEEYIAGDVVYVADVAAHPTDMEIVNVCAMPKEVILRMTGADEATEEVTEEVAEDVTETGAEDGDDELVMEPEVVNAMQPEKNHRSEETMQSEKNHRSEDKRKPRTRKHVSDGPSLFDEYLQEFAKHNSEAGFYSSFSIWHGKEVMTWEPSLLWKIYIYEAAVLIIGEQMLAPLFLEHNDHIGHLHAICGAIIAALVLLVVAVIIQIKLWRMK